MNWPQYLVWDQYQRSFVKQCHKNCLSIRVVGPIYFSDQANHSSLPTNFDPSRSIAVFDVQPFRSSIYQVFGFASDFYIPDQCIRFVSDILVCAAEFDVTILLKSKREIGSRSHPKYRLFLDSLSSHDNVVFIDPAVSAYRLVESCVGSVSMPYTSTAIIFRQAGVPSIYYAPLLSPHVDPSPTHGIQLVQHPYNLRSWISSLISSNLASNS
jgi:polysaccharide biosynthesis PFTS motif protein